MTRVRLLMLGASLIALAGCGGSQSAVGENSADSITTTAVGNVVASQPSPAPTAIENAAATADNAAMSIDTGAASNDVLANAGMSNGE